jgi:hypothetical protein
MANSFNAEQVLADFKNWNQQLKKYQVPSTRRALIQVLNSFSFYVGLWALQFYLYDHSVSSRFSSRRSMASCLDVYLSYSMTAATVLLPAASCLMTSSARYQALSP